MRVLITQRVDMYPDRSERRDALDQKWGDALARMLGRPPLIYPMPNRSQDIGAILDCWAPALIVLSGGNDLGQAPERDATEAALLEIARSTGIPVLAVCRGMQMVQHHLGGELVPISGHVGCEHVVTAVRPDAGPAELHVNSFHSWGVPRNGLARGIEELYGHSDGTVEAARHVDLPWLCVMWHPERAGSGIDTANDWAGRWLGEVL